ncbi:MAG: hypothetical protein WAU88_02065 [Candidatus Zixiibacteriota bacterium]
MRKILGLLISLIWLPVISSAGPKVVVPEKSWDFGNVPQHITVSHAYWLKNVGDDTLEILSVKPG